MRGYPNKLTAKEDYIYIKEHFEKSRWAPDWQALLDSRLNWFITGELDKDVEGTTDEFHKVIVEETEGGEARRFQAELREDPNCKLLRLGFTVKEVKKALA